MATFWSSIGLPTRDAEPLANYEVLEWNPPPSGRRIPGHYTEDGNVTYLRFLQLQRGYFTVDGNVVSHWRWRLFLKSRDNTAGLASTPGDDLSEAVEGRGFTLYHVRESASGTFTTERSINLNLSSPDDTEPYEPQVQVPAVKTFVQGYRDNRPGAGETDYFLFRITDGRTLSIGYGRINQSATVGENFSYQFRTASGWPSGVTYSATGLPPGVTFNGTTRMFGGVPTTSGSWDVTITARVSAGVLTSDTTSYTTTETATRTVRITVAAATPSLTVRSISNKTGTVGARVSFTAGGATWSSGNPTGLTYSATGLPPGITLSDGTLFSGTPTRAGTFRVTYSASAPGFTGDSETFTWTISAQLPLQLAAIANRDDYSGRAIRAFTGPEATAPGRGSPTIHYTATGLPPGISFNSSNRRFSGTPDTNGTYTVTYTAQSDDDFADGVRTFTWTIEEPPFLTLGTALDRSGLSGDAVNFRGPAASASTGSPTITYTAAGLPPGISFNASTRRFTGAPTAGGDYTVEYEASATGYINSRTTFTWTVTDRILTVGAISNRSDESGSPITAFTGPAASANTGSPSISYRASDLPPGISFNRSTRVFSGTPTSTGTYICSYAVSASNYRSATRSFRWEITAAKSLSLASISDRDSTVNAQITAFAAPAATASTGSPSVTYRATGLPAGISFNANTRAFSGTPTRVRAYTVTVTASASGYSSASRSFRWTISNLPDLHLGSIDDRSDHTGTAIRAFTGPTAAIAGRNQPTITYTVEGLPPGINFNASNRRFSGTPTGGSNQFNVRYRASAEGVTDAITDFTWTIIESRLSLAAISDQTGTVGAPITALTFAAATANRGSPTIRYRASGTPAGIAFSGAQRRFSGSPTTAGTSTVTVTASAAGFTSASRSFTWTIGGTPALSLSAITGLSGFTGDSVSFTGPAASANTGSPSVTYAVTGLPAGVSFDASTRAFSGAPTTAGDYTVTYTATATGYTAASRSFSWEVTGKALSVAFIPTQNSTEDSAATTVTGPVATANTGAPTVTYSASGLPPGISFTASSRQFSGTPTSSGTWTVTYTASASGYSDGTTSFTWNVGAAPTLSLGGISNRTGTVGTRTSFTAPTASANTGSPNIGYAATGLPPGISRNGRILSGTPTQAGTYSVTYSASASGYEGASTTFTWTIREALALSLTSIPDRSDPAGNSITNWTGPAGSANRGSPPISYRAAPLPPGISFNASTRVFSGTPTTTGSWTLTYRAAAHGYITSRQQFTWAITSAQTLSLGSISDQADFADDQITAFSAPAATASTGSPTITYAATGLPDGISFNTSTRTFSGTPTTAGSSTVTVTATASDYTSASRTFTWTVTAKALSLAAIADQDDTAGTPITALTLPTAGANTGSPTVNYTASGTPAGIAFSGAQRRFSGTPTSAGTYTVTVTASASGYASASRTFTWSIAITPSLSIGEISNRAGHTGNQITAFDAPAATWNTGSPTVTYSATGLPPGISFSGREFSGTPTTAGSYSITVTATATGYISATTSFTWDITQRELSFSTFITDRTSTAGTGISAFTGPGASANTGSPSVTYAVSGLPAGVRFTAASRRFSGTPTTAGTFNVTYTASATGYTTATETFTWTIEQNPTLTFSETIQDRTSFVGDPVPSTFVGPVATANTGSPTIRYRASGTPHGVGLWQSRRRFTGTPNRAGTYTVTYSAHANGYEDAHITFTWTISEKNLTLAELIPDKTGTVDRQITGFTGPEATTTAGSPTVTYSVSGLPAGITFTPSTRQFTGRPTDTGSHSVVYTATASGYRSASDTFEWTINATPAATITAGTKAEASIRGFSLAGRMTAGTSATAVLRGGISPHAAFSAGSGFSPYVGQELRYEPNVSLTAGALLQRATLEHGGSVTSRLSAGSRMRPTIVTFGAPGFQILDIGTPSAHSVVAGVQLYSWDLTIGTPQWEPMKQTLVADGSTDIYIEQLFVSWQPPEYDDDDVKIADSEARMGIYLTGHTDFTRQLEDATSAFAFEAPALDLLVIPGLGQISGTDPREPYIYRFTGTQADAIGDWLEQYSTLTPQALSGTRFILDDNRRELVGVFSSGTHTRLPIDQEPEIVELEPAATFGCGAKSAESLFERSTLRAFSQEFELLDRDVYLNSASTLQWAPVVDPNTYLPPTIDPELRHEPSIEQGLLLIGFQLPPQSVPKVALQTIALDFSNAGRDLTLAFESIGVLVFECGDGAGTTHTLILRIGQDLAADYAHPYNFDTLSDTVTQRIIDWVTAWRALPQGGRNCSVTLTAPHGQFMSFRMTAGTQINPPIHQRSERRVVVEKYSQAGTRFSPSITHTQAFSGVSARLYRYAIYIPGTARGRTWAFWSGDDGVTIGNTVYSAGQWAGFDDGAPISGIHSTQLHGVEAMTLRFAATDLFRTWLLSGDAAGRIASIYSIAAEGTAWVIKNEVVRGRIGDTRSLENGLIEAEFSAAARSNANFPSVITYGVHKAEFDGDTSARFVAELDAGFKVDFP